MRAIILNTSLGDLELIVKYDRGIDWLVTLPGEVMVKGAYVKGAMAGRHLGAEPTINIGSLTQRGGKKIGDNQFLALKSIIVQAVNDHFAANPTLESELELELLDAEIANEEERLRIIADGLEYSRSRRDEIALRVQLMKNPPPTTND